MNKSKFVTILSSKLKIRRPQAKKFLDSFFSSMIDVLKEKGSVTIRGFGSFKVVLRKEKKILNPKTKKFIKIAQKKILTFKPYNKFKNRIK